MIITVKFFRMCVSIVTIFCGFLTSPLLSMETSNKEDSGLNSLFNNFFTARVVEVVTGDTIKVRRTGESSDSVEQIRLDGTWAPQKDTPFGISAQKFLEEMVLGREISIKGCINSCKEVSCANEIQAIIYMGEICVNQELVSKKIVWANPIQGLPDGERRGTFDRTKRRVSFKMEYSKNPIKRVCSQ